MALNWVGNQGYNETEDKANEFSLKSKEGFIGVTVKLHHYVGCGNVWFVSCHQLGIERREIGDVDTNEAKKIAYDIVKHKVQELYNAVNSMDS